ncbi:MAG TPA: glycine cleavage T C-terminal barrel domain-containing protein [Patescibacteria group bacterium]|nr:glycine cleavage T C-terminal barrel domain-containing protein [Patescibacteria group bacterium]
MNNHSTNHLMSENVISTTLHTARTSAAWRNCNSLGKITAKGADRIDLLNRLSTNELKDLQNGQGRQTVLTTEKGRIVDVLTILAEENSLFIITSENNAQPVRDYLRKYTIMDDFKTADITEDFGAIEIFGPRSGIFLKEALGIDVQALPMHGFQKENIFGTDIIIARRESVAELAYLLVYRKESEEEIIHAFKNYGPDMPEIDRGLFTTLRVEAGMGILGAEWTTDYNPLEAGLLHNISFKKGCYVGQEVIARLDSYNKVSKRLTGFISEREIPVGAEIFADGKAVGKITTSAFSELLKMNAALGYIRSEFAQENHPVEISHNGEKFPANVVKPPFKK